jgi:dihydrofolate reductase
MISIIAAMAENRVIGSHNALPWKLPADLRHFRTLTTGHHVIMGRRNYESIGRPLPHRKNIVVTRRSGYTAPGCLVTHSLEEALELARGDPEVFIIGGGEIYRQALDRADRQYLTLVHARVAGDTLFPEFDWNEWKVLSRERHEADDKNPHAYSFITLERIRETTSDTR